MPVLDQLLKTQLAKAPKEMVPDTTDDRFEEVRPYRRWTLGLRTVLRLRYLALKQQVLMQFRSSLKYDTETAEVQASVLDVIKGWCAPQARWTFLLTPLIVYPLLLALIAAAAVGISRQIDAGRQRAIFENDIPRLSDTVYSRQAEQARTTADASRLQELEQQIEILKNRITLHFSELPGIRDAMSVLLDAVDNPDVTAKDLVDSAKVLNDQLYAGEIPYYVSTITETAQCSALPSERFLERLFGGSESTGDLCRVHALLTFDVEESRYYTDERQNHLAYFTRRLDNLEIHESVLGRVHIGDDTAQVLLSNIEGSSSDSLTAVSNGVRQSKLMPQGMPDVYGLESLARRLQSNVINQYVEEFESRWWNRVRPLLSELTGNSPDPLAFAANRLQHRIADVTAFHEIQHLVDQSTSLEEPEWLKDTISVFGKRVVGEGMRQHILWELSAFFTHLANADELQGVLLNEFTAITLNPMLQDQPHFYSVRILLPVLHQMLKGDVQIPPVAARSLGDVARAYKSLAVNADDLGRLSREAYPILFGRPLPELREILVAAH